ncbi:MAG: lysozyme [Bacteroidales bacterium]|nr:lysozyme [Bacteroidales bacterium]
MHNPKHWPNIGYGHQVKPGEPYRCNVQLTEVQADALLYKELKKFCALYSEYSRDLFSTARSLINAGPVS